MRWFARCSLLGVSAAMACGAFGKADDGSPADGSRSPDASTDKDDAADGGRPASGFVLALDPPHVTADPGDTFDVTIHLARAASFAEIVQFAISGSPLYVTATVPGATSGDTSRFSIAFAATAPGASTLTVTGTGGGAESLVQLDLWVGSEVGFDGGAFRVPPFAVNGLDVKAWGAGGGGYLGGAGGFASARLLVVPNETLVVDVGAPGTSGFGSGGSGGGFSAVRRDGSTYLLIAGGGGGSGTSGNGGNGGSGGGVTGEDGSSSGGGGGSANAGGSPGMDFSVPTPATGGSRYLGGAGASESTFSYADGGAPGGGRSGDLGNDGTQEIVTGGGGGGSYGGGGGGGAASVSGGGGGGGSGFIMDASVDGSLLTGIGGTPPKTADPDYGDGGNAGKAGFPGRVVVRLPKPY